MKGKRFSQNSFSLPTSDKERVQLPAVQDTLKPSVLELMMLTTLSVNLQLRMNFASGVTTLMLLIAPSQLVTMQMQFSTLSVMLIIMIIRLIGLTHGTLLEQTISQLISRATKMIGDTPYVWAVVFMRLPTGLTMQARVFKIFFRKSVFKHKYFSFLDLNLLSNLYLEKFTSISGNLKLVNLGFA